METFDTIEIQSATADDVAQIAKIQIEAWQAAYSMHSLEPAVIAAFQQTVEKRWLSKFYTGYVLWVARRGADLIGFISLLADTDVTLIDALHVKPSHWRAGVGGTLFATALEQAKKSGCRVINTWLLEGNDRVAAFYETLGFVRSAIEKNLVLGEGADAKEVQYQLQLTDVGMMTEVLHK